jgi:MGT family glycosyltransferase
VFAILSHAAVPVAKILFLNFAAAGHVNPILPIISALTLDDGQVACALPEAWREKVEGSGATLLPLQAALPGPPPDDEQLALLPYKLAAAAPHTVPLLLDAIAGFQPDCIVYNSLYLQGRLAAQIAGIRAAAFRPYHAPHAQRPLGPPYPTAEIAAHAEAADAALSYLAKTYRLPPITLPQLAAPDEALTFIFMPRAFQHGAEHFDDRFVFTGACLPPVRPPKNFLTGLTPSLTKKIYISLGTMRNDDTEFYRLCVMAFGSGDWSPILSIGYRVPRQDLGQLPENFQVAPHVPQLTVLSEADIFITQGGLNSTMESLFYGVPMIVIPNTREQRLTARRIRDLGLGIMLERAELTEDLLRTTARDVVADRSMRDRVRHMQQLTREAGGAQFAADVLLHYAGG